MSDSFFKPEDIEKCLGWETKEKNKQQDLTLIDEYTIKCPDCEIPILTIIKVKEDDDHKKLQAICPLCNEASFVVNINGNIYMAAIEPYIIADIIETDGKILIKVTK
jgi:Zn finger protein HypA/HybF involved in hydrogenase expression